MDTRIFRPGQMKASDRNLKNRNLSKRTQEVFRINTFAILRMRPYPFRPYLSTSVVAADGPVRLRRRRSQQLKAIVDGERTVFRMIKVEIEATSP